MLRLIFVLTIIAVGGLYALTGPFYALLFYLWYAYFRPEQWLWSDVVSGLNLSLITGVLLLVSSALVLRTFRWTAQAVLILLMLAQCCLSMLMAEHPAWSQTYWLEFVKVLTVSLLMTFLINDQKRYRLTLLVIGYSLGLEAAKQGWAQLVLNPGGQNNNTHPVLGDNNGVAVGMMMLVPIFGALAATATTRWERYLHRVFAIGLLYRGLSTYSRGGLLAAAAIGVMGLVRSQRKIRTIFVTGALSIALATAMPSGYWTRMRTIGDSQESQDESAKGRLSFWHTAILMASARPLTGVGPNGFSRSYSSYDASDGLYGDQRAVHSAWFGALADLGYPGLFLLVAVVTVAILTCRRVRRATRGDPQQGDLRIYASALEMTFVAYVVGATFINAHYSEMFWQMIGLSGALRNLGAFSVESVRNAAVQPATFTIARAKTG